MNPAATLSDDGLTIFLFHGVVERSPYAVRNYLRKHLDRDGFVRLLRGLAGAGRAVSMEQVVQHHEAREPFPPRAFAITFDDGFENNCSIAAPILKDLNLPATFYITSGFIEHNAMSWVDRIEYCLEIAPAGRLRLPWADRPQDFATAADRIRLLDAIRFHVKRDPAIDVDTIVSDIFAQCGVEEIQRSDDPLDRKMTWQQVADLHADDLFTVGGHTHRHRILSFLPPDELEAEVRTSIELCRDRAGIAVRHYSYPEGLRHCYSPAVIDVLRRHGIVCCPTAEPGVNRHSDDLFHLKRVAPTTAETPQQQGRSHACVA